MAKSPQREVRLELDGQVHVAQFGVHDFAHGGHTLVVWFRGRKSTEQIPPEMNYEAYTDFLAEKMLERLVKENDIAEG